MFNSSKELESAMYNILIKIHKGQNISNLLRENSNDENFEYALEQCIVKEFTQGLSITYSATRTDNTINISNPNLSPRGLEFIENFHMNFNDLTDIQSKFNLLSDELLESTGETFDANLYSFKEFCTFEKILIDIIDPISKTDFDGNEYIFGNSNIKPKNQSQLLKLSYDIVLNSKTNYDTIWRYAFISHSNIRDTDELFEFGKNELFVRLINYINSELLKKINNTENPHSPNQVNYNIQTANNSIIGNQQNATINNGMTFDEISKYIQEQNDINLPDKEQLLELTNCLKTLTENNIPIKKGTLAKFSDIVSKHSWCLTLIGNALIKHFIS